MNHKVQRIRLIVCRRIELAEADAIRYFRIIRYLSLHFCGLLRSRIEAQLLPANSLTAVRDDLFLQ